MGTYPWQNKQFKQIQWVGTVYSARRNCQVGIPTPGLAAPPPPPSPHRTGDDAGIYMSERYIYEYERGCEHLSEGGRENDVFGQMQCRRKRKKKIAHQKDYYDYYYDYYYYYYYCCWYVRTSRWYVV